MKKVWWLFPAVDGSLKEQLLKNRKITKQKDREIFSSGFLNQLTNSSKLFPDLEKAIARLSRAIKNQEPIYVYGDYDVDGITGSAILWETIDFLGGKVLPYIPSRRSEGYGLHSEALEALAKEGAKVVISVDCGITAVEEAKVAKAHGIDLIITDHHQPQERLPEPYALVHSTSLAGSGVAFLLAEALLSAFNKETDEQYFKNLELATLGTVADMVPLTADNRIIVKNGLPLLSKTTRLGLQALYEEAGVGKVVGTYEIGFMISPRLNAMGRLDSAMDSLRLLLTKKRERGRVLATILGQTNKERQQRTFEVFEHAKKQVEESYSDRKFLVVDSDKYPEGVVGLVASRLVEKFYRPTAVIGKGEAVFKGSARSISGFNITQAIHAQEDLLVSHGGHPMAAGFSIQGKNISLFRERLERLAKDSLTDEELVPILKIDSEISLEQINDELETLLKDFEPFGIGNPEPLFVTRRLLVLDVRTVGKENNHLKLTLKDKDGRVINGIGFDLNSKKPNKGDLVDIVYNIRENYWNSRKNLEARIKDLKPSSVA